MIRKIWNQLAAKCVNRETVSYFIFGVLTTAVDWVGYFALYNMGYSVVFSQTMSWAAAVLFAFITNKLFVFESKGLSRKELAREFFAFIAARLVSLGMEELGLWLMIGALHWNENLAKLIMQVVVVIANYVFSKLFIFKKTAVEE